MSMILHRLLLCAAAVVFAVPFAGCYTLVGLAVGTGIDASSPDSTVVSGDELMSVPSGSAGVLTLDDGTRREVQGLRAELYQPTDHRVAFAAALTEVPVSLPLPLDTVRLVLGSKAYSGSILRGYCLTGLWVSTESGHDDLFVAWDRVTGVRTGSGEVWTGSDLQETFITHRLPSRNGIRFTTATSNPASLLYEDVPATASVPVTAVRSLRLEASHNAKWWLMAAGTFVDLVAVQISFRGFRGFNVHR